MRPASHLRLAVENDDAAVPPLSQLCVWAFEKGILVPEINREFLWAAVDPDAYALWAHARLDQAGVPKELRRFDHDTVVKTVKAKFASAKSK